MQIEANNVLLNWKSRFRHLGKADGTRLLDEVSWRYLGWAHAQRQIGQSLCLGRITREGTAGFFDEVVVPALFKHFSDTHFTWKHGHGVF